jgi:hypothetical protein
MAVTENYHSMPHINRDLFNSVISWFLEGKCSYSACVYSEHFQLFEKKKEFVGLHLDPTIVNLVGV